MPDPTADTIVVEVITDSVHERLHRLWRKLWDGELGGKPDTAVIMLDRDSYKALILDPEARGSLEIPWGGSPGSGVKWRNHVVEIRERRPEIVDFARVVEKTDHGPVHVETPAKLISFRYQGRRGRVLYLDDPEIDPKWKE